MSITFSDLTARQRLISVVLTLLCGLAGAWWYASSQEAWSWISFSMTFSFVVGMVSLFMLVEVLLKKHLSQYQTGFIHGVAVSVLAMLLAVVVAA